MSEASSELRLDTSSSSTDSAACTSMAFGSADAKEKKLLLFQNGFLISILFCVVPTGQFIVQYSLFYLIPIITRDADQPF